jgi:hypothetical protein
MHHLTVCVPFCSWTLFYIHSPRSGQFTSGYIHCSLTLVPRGHMLSLSWAPFPWTAASVTTKVHYVTVSSADCSSQSVETPVRACSAMCASFICLLICCQLSSYLFIFHCICYTTKLLENNHFHFNISHLLLTPKIVLICKILLWTVMNTEQVCIQSITKYED